MKIWINPEKKTENITGEVFSPHPPYALYLTTMVCGILVPPLGIEPAPRALEEEVLITGLPGKSPTLSLFFPHLPSNDC